MRHREMRVSDVRIVMQSGGCLYTNHNVLMNDTRGIIMRKPNPYQDMEEVPEKCCHPKELCYQSDADCMGMFYFECRKCGQTFSRYANFKTSKEDKTRFND